DPAIMNRLLGIWSKNADGSVAVDTTTDSYDTSLETVARLRRDPAFAIGGVVRIDLDGELQILQIAPVGVLISDIQEWDTPLSPTSRSP
ncbi:hypothetical protein AB9F35_34355, partial [Rhizobium leguminosarum]